MAWKARITSINTNVNDGENIHCHVDYIDDADTTTTLYSRDFRFPATQSRADMQAAVVFEGQRARDTFNKAATLQGQVPQNTVIAIP